MKSRIEFARVAPAALEAITTLEHYVRTCGIEFKLLELIKIRASQINGCAYCLDMHTKDARAHGETEQRIYALNAWRETPFFSGKERAALAWTEAVTLVSASQVADEVYEIARPYFTEKELVDITLAIITINSWNRLAISFRSVPGTYQPPKQADHTAGMNPLRKLEALGQSIWMDFIRRGMIASGQLKQLIEEDGLCGVTSNPSIFEKAITGSSDYDEAIRVLAQEGRSAEQIYDALTIEDIQHVADLFRPVYDRLDGMDGFVSLEVSPYLAHDTAATIAEARRLWGAVNRPNVMIKVPGTTEGLPAIQQLIGEGINVNITLLFGLPRYRQVADAYLAGLEALSASGKPMKSVASVASFFLSRIDVLIDPTLEELMASDKPEAEVARSLRGQVATHSAKAAYRIYQEIFASERFAKLKAQGARVQRLLWASTSTKNPAYSDLKYVEALIGPETINTVPLETLEAYRDHGQPVVRLTDDISTASAALLRLADIGIDLDKATQQLEDEGVQKFAKAFDDLMKKLKVKQSEMLGRS